MTIDASRRLQTQLRSFYGFKTQPFAKDLDPDQLFTTEALSRSLERLAYLADRQGTGAVFGTPGTGKSTLLRSFVESLGKPATASVTSRTPTAARPISTATSRAAFRSSRAIARPTS